MKIIQSKLPRFEDGEEECTLTIDTVYTFPMTLGVSKIAIEAEAIIAALQAIPRGVQLMQMST